MLALALARTNAWAGPAEDYTSGLQAFREKNYPGAYSLLRRSADQGYALSQGMLCSMHSYGEGVPKDPATAFGWCRKAAEQGEKMSQFDLGNMYMRGEGTTPDAKKGVEWTRRSAQAGHAPAYFNLGVYHYKGTGVEKSPSEAYKWFLLARTSGINEATRWVQLLEGRMSAAELSNARRFVREWQPSGR